MTSHAQRLINSFFEAVVRLLHIPIFMRYPGIIPRRLHPVMSHKRLVALRPVLRAALALLLDCRAQMIGAVLLWNASDLPQTILNPLSQGLKATAQSKFVPSPRWSRSTPGGTPYGETGGPQW